jgi:uncharacterized protein YlxW (UPF0749 family)
MPELAPDRQLPDRVTMPLLALITQQSLDEDYRHVAERRAPQAPRPTERRRSHRTAAVVTAVFGLLVTIAAVQTSRNATVNDASRMTLVRQITAERASVSRLQDEIVRLRQVNVGLQERLGQVSGTAQSTVARLRRLETTTGFVAVSGPGVRATVNDAPNGDPAQAVRDEDLALLVDGLWAAGAEAISINGQRLTALSAIRNSGPAIHVNGRPLAPPYTVLAIGDTRTMQANLLDSTHGSEFYSLARQLQFVYELRNEDSLNLPAAPDRLLRLRNVSSGTLAEQPNRIEEEATP